MSFRDFHFSTVGIEEQRPGNGVNYSAMLRAESVLQG
jgi:hypothetical protein